MVHRNGKVNLTEAKAEETQTERGEAHLMGTRLRIEKEDSMQWEKVMEIIPVVKLEVKEKKYAACVKHGSWGKRKPKLGEQ